MAKYTIYPNKKVSFTSKRGTKYLLINKNGKLICYSDGKKCMPTKEILSRFNVAGGEFTIHTGGFCFDGQGGKGGYAVILCDKNGSFTQLSEGFAFTTKNRMEILAAITGIEATPRGSRISLHSSSDYLIKTMKGNYRKIRNLDLWKRLEKECSVRKIEFILVENSSDNELNNACLKLAKTSACGKKLNKDDGYGKKMQIQKQIGK